MKKGTLLLLAIITLTTVNANNIDKSTSKIGVNYRYDDAVTFVERGIQFHVFLNGEFDFNTHYRNSTYVDYNGRRAKLNNRNNNGIHVNRDYRGRVRRVGNTFINYDHRGNVKRIGNIYINYKSGQLSRVGNLKIKYDRWGNPRFYGNVKYNNEYHYNDNIGIDISLGDVCDYNDVYFYNRNFTNNYRQFKEDNNFYYYRAKPNAKIGKRNRILKRKKYNRSYSKQNKSKRNINHYEKRERSNR